MLAWTKVPTYWHHVKMHFCSRKRFVVQWCIQCNDATCNAICITERCLRCLSLIVFKIFAFSTLNFVAKSCQKCCWCVLIAHWWKVLTWNHTCKYLWSNVCTLKIVSHMAVWFKPVRIKLNWLADGSNSFDKIQFCDYAKLPSASVCCCML